MLAGAIESVGMLTAVVAPLVAVPLTLVTFYLRSLREGQSSLQGDVKRRMEIVETRLSTLGDRMGEFERDYTTKEEWLRECMLARQSLVHLTETTVRLEVLMGGRTHGAGGSSPRNAGASAVDEWVTPTTLRSVREQGGE